MAKKQIKSKERVADRGEVFTNEREVKAMCDLVGQECDRIDSKFLEPACGDGNFLAEILTRKLARVKQLYGKSPFDYERYSLLAVMSIYGVDIMQDNVIECRARMFEIWDKEYQKNCKKLCNNETRESVIYVLEKNILCGNALTLVQVDKHQNDTNEPIIFPEWSMIMGGKFKRRDFRLDVLLKEYGDENSYQQFTLDFDGDSADSSKYWERDPITNVIIPLPVKEYEAMHYKKLKEAE